MTRIEEFDKFEKLTFDTLALCTRRYDEREYDARNTVGISSLCNFQLSAVYGLQVNHTAHTIENKGKTRYIECESRVQVKAEYNCTHVLLFIYVLYCNVYRRAHCLLLFFFIYKC